MTRNEKRSYFNPMRERYAKSTKAKRGKILDEFCEVCGYNRKYAIRKLGQPIQKTSQSKSGPRSKYQQSKIIEPLKTIWLNSDQMCSKKLKVILPTWLPFYEEIYGQLSIEVKNTLLTISSASIDRAPKPIKVIAPKKGLSGTKPGSILKQHIPIKTDHWDVTKPGFVEADTVAHCGNSLAGSFVWSLTLTDILST